MAVAPIGPLAWELPYAIGVALKKRERERELRLSHKHREQTFLVKGSERDWEFGVDGCKVLHLEWSRITSFTPDWARPQFFFYQQLVMTK